MSMLDLELKHIASVEGSIKKAVSRLESQKDDYEGIMRDVNGIESSTGNLSTCNTYLRKKRDKVQSKIDRLNTFKNNIKTFSDNAKKADERVATYVTDESNTFYKAVGIKTGWSAAWDGFKKGVKKGWKVVHDFYEKHKFVIDFIVDLALLAVAVVALVAAIPTGGATLFFAGWGLATALGDITTSSLALGYHIIGDDESAGIWADRGLKDGMEWVGRKLGGEEGAAIMGLIFDGISIASVVYSIGKMGKNFFKAFDLRNTNDMSIGKRFAQAGKTLFDVKVTKFSDGKTLAGCWQIKEFFHLKSIRTAGALLVTGDVIKNIKTTYKTIDSVYKGTFFTEGNAISSTFDKTINAIKDFIRDAAPVKPYLKTAVTVL